MDVMRVCLFQGYEISKRGVLVRRNDLNTFNPSIQVVFPVNGSPSLAGRRTGKWGQDSARYL